MAKTLSVMYGSWRHFSYSGCTAGGKFIVIGGKWPTHGCTVSAAKVFVYFWVLDRLSVFTPWVRVFPERTSSSFDRHDDASSPAHVAFIVTTVVKWRTNVVNTFLIISCIPARERSSIFREFRKLSLRQKVIPQNFVLFSATACTLHCLLIRPTVFRCLINFLCCLILSTNHSIAR